MKLSNAVITESCNAMKSSLKGIFPGSRLRFDDFVPGMFHRKSAAVSENIYEEYRGV